MGKLKVCIPKDKDKIEKQIKALKWQLTQEIQMIRIKKYTRWL